MKIAVIGLGHIGRARGRCSSTRDTSSSRDRARGTGAATGATTGDVADAVSGAEVVVVAIPFGAWPAFAYANAGALADKVVIDITKAGAERDRVARN